jgi:hypothetical protein
MAREIARYRLDFVQVQEVRCDKEQAEDYTVFCGNRTEIIN